MRKYHAPFGGRPTEKDYPVVPRRRPTLRNGVDPGRERRRGLIRCPGPMDPQEKGLQQVFRQHRVSCGSAEVGKEPCAIAGEQFLKSFCAPPLVCQHEFFVCRLLSCHLTPQGALADVTAQVGGSEFGKADIW